MLTDTPPAVRLLLRCTGIDPPTDAQLDRLAARVADWDRFLAAAGANCVRPVVATRLSPAPDAVPARVQQALDDAADAAARRTLRRVQSLFTLLDAFDEAGVRALPYKGPVVAAVAYETLARRPFGDLDFLVPRADVASAAATLRDRGFELAGDSWVSPAAVARGDTTVSPPPEFAFHRPRDDVEVEVRWRLGTDARPLSIVSSLWERRESTTVAGRRVPSLAADDRLLVLSRHGTKHRWRRLSWVLDVAHCLDGISDETWRALASRARSLDVHRDLALATLLATDCCGAVVPEDAATWARTSRLVTNAARHVERRLATDPTATPATVGPSEQVTFDVALYGPSACAASTVTRELLVPDGADRGFLSLPRRFRSAYLVVRPVRLLLKGAGRLVPGR